MSIRIASVAVLAALLAPAALAAEPATYGVRLQELTPYTGRASEADPSRLPAGVEGRLPSRVGQGFALAIEPGLYSGRDGRSIAAALAELLPATGYTGEVGALTLAAESTLPAFDADAVARERETDQRALEAEPAERFGTLGEVTGMALDIQGDSAEARLASSHRVVRYTQDVDGITIEGLGVVVVVDDADGSIVRLSGALVNDPTMDRMALGAERAEAIAKARLEEETAVRSVETTASAVATDTGVRGVYNVEADTRAGPFRVRVDGATGEILAIEALAMAYKPAEGRAFTPDPAGTAQTYGFEVNDAVNGSFKLAHSNYLTVTPVGVDGCDSVPVSVSGSSLADFDVAPINDTTNVEDATAPGYNCQFQEVNAFALLHDAIVRFEANGTQPIPVLSVEVNDDNPCGFGLNNACASGTKLAFAVGGGTRDGSTDPAALWNTALDQTVVIHELGHVVNGVQYGASGGTLHDSVNEGLADYWAWVLLDGEDFGVWSGQNRMGFAQNGMLPRRFDSFDVFPDHFLVGQNEAHSNGQMLGWALSNMRNGIRVRSPLGGKIADDILLDAMTTAGSGISNSSSTGQIYYAFQDLLGALLVSAGNTQERVDVLQGFARAGIFTTKRESVVDISDDFLSKNDAPPTFTVWGGEDFFIDGNDDVIDILPQHNLCYRVEIATDEAFTQNHVMSAETCAMPSSNGNRRGTWTPTAAEWDQVNDGALVYYRAWTRQKDGSDERRSDRTMAGFMQVPVARAILNEGSGSSCDTTGKGAGTIGLLAGLALLARRKR